MFLVRTNDHRMVPELRRDTRSNTNSNTRWWSIRSVTQETMTTSSGDEPLGGRLGPILVARLCPFFGADAVRNSFRSYSTVNAK